MFNRQPRQVLYQLLFAIKYWRSNYLKQPPTNVLLESNFIGGAIKNKPRKTYQLVTPFE